MRALLGLTVAAAPLGPFVVLVVADRFGVYPYGVSLANWLQSTAFTFASLWAFGVVLARAGLSVRGKCFPPAMERWFWVALAVGLTGPILVPDRWLWNPWD